MSIIQQLSSQVGDKTEESNKKVVAECLKNPSLLKELTQALSSPDAALIGDAAEVFTKVAEVEPSAVSSYADALIPLLDHKNTRARWEAMHALSYIAPLVPKAISASLDTIHRLALSDTSTIVRDYAVETVSQYAKVDEKTAQESLPVLKRVLEVWKEKHAARAITGLRNAVVADPGLKSEVASTAKPFESSSKGTVKKALKDLYKATNG